MHLVSVVQSAHTWLSSLIVAIFASTLQFVSLPYASRSTLAPIRPLATMTDSTQWFRLPADARPMHYDLTIFSDLELSRINI